MKRAALFVLVAFYFGGLPALKLAGVIDWSWWWVCAPLLLWLVPIGVLLLLGVFFRIDIRE